MCSFLFFFPDLAGQGLSFHDRFREASRLGWSQILFFSQVFAALSGVFSQQPGQDGGRPLSAPIIHVSGFSSESFFPGHNFFWCHF